MKKILINIFYSARFSEPQSYSLTKVPGRNYYRGVKKYRGGKIAIIIWTSKSTAGENIRHDVETRKEYQGSRNTTKLQIPVLPLRGDGREQVTHN